jgi:uncharacterized surface protein with fasciclin (FAS1) repeats
MNSKRSVTFAAVGLALALGTAACTTDTSTDAESPTPTASASATAAADNTIVEVAAQAGTFTTLVDAVTAAGLADTLSGGEYTVFAPTDEAFKPLVDDGTVTELLKNPEGQLTDILLYHVVEGEITAEEIVKLDGQDVKTLQGGTLKVMVTDDGKVTLVDGAGQTITVVTADVEASNGVIHVVDGVLLPSK